MRTILNMLQKKSIGWRVLWCYNWVTNHIDIGETYQGGSFKWILVEATDIWRNSNAQLWAFCIVAQRWRSNGHGQAVRISRHFGNHHVDGRSSIICNQEMNNKMNDNVIHDIAAINKVLMHLRSDQSCSLLFSPECLPDPGGRPTKGFVGLFVVRSVGRSVSPSFPTPTSRGGRA